MAAADMDARDSNAWENPFSGAGGATGEILDVPAGGGEPEPTEKVFVAVPELYKNGKSVLTWALRHATAAVLVVAHVHAPAQMIPMSTYSLLSRRATSRVTAVRSVSCGSDPEAQGH
jgi:hypothetical protein